MKQDVMPSHATVPLSHLFLKGSQRANKQSRATAPISSDVTADAHAI